MEKLKVRRYKKENILFINARRRDNENISIVSKPLFFCTYFGVLSEIPPLTF